MTRLQVFECAVMHRLAHRRALYGVHYCEVCDRTWSSLWIPERRRLRRPRPSVLALVRAIPSQLLRLLRSA